MAGIKGQQKAEGFERIILDEGMYDMRLVKVMAMQGKPSQFAPEGAAKIMMIWEWVDEDGSHFKTDDDQPYALVDMLGLPKNLRYNEKSNYWKRLSGIAGQTINNDNIDMVEHDFGPFVGSYDDIVELITSPDIEKPDKLGKAPVTSIMVGGAEQIGKICRLVVKKTQSDTDKAKFYNNIESVLQLQAAGPKKPPAGKKTAAPAAQPELVAAGAMPRPQTTEPAHADLPY